MKTNVITNIFCAVALSASGLTFGQTQVPHTFQAGQPARAAEVNENFSAMETAVNDNASALAVNETAIQQNTAAITAFSSDEVTILDFTDPDACTIDEPGYYVLDRSWDFSQPDPQGACNDSGVPGTGGVKITASNVTLDLRQFELKLKRPAGSDISETVVGTGADNVTVRQGTLVGLTGIGPYMNELGSVTVENMTIYGDVNLRVGSVLNSHLEGPGRLAQFRGCKDVNCGAVVVLDSTLICTTRRTKCIVTDTSVGNRFSSVVIRNNRITGTGGIYVRGSPSNTIIEGNLIKISMDWHTDNAIWAFGPAIVARNTIFSDSGIGNGILIWDTGAIVESNLIKGTGVGINFRELSHGNYFGNNRISAITPFEGTNDQTDWGGNVSF